MSMEEFKHLVVAKFKEGVVVEDIIKGMEKLVSQVDLVKSFVWGEDVESLEMLRQGFTHAFLMTFSNKEDFTAFQCHPKHLEFSATFSTAIQNVVLLDFPAVLVMPARPTTDQEEPVERAKPTTTDQEEPVERAKPTTTDQEEPVEQAKPTTEEKPPAPPA